MINEKKKYILKAIHRPQTSDFRAINRFQGGEFLLRGWNLQFAVKMQRKLSKYSLKYVKKPHKL